MSPTPVSTAGESARLDADILAAGAILWREQAGDLRVLLVHRPKYRDWSWPKGKTDPGETLPECAVREVREETGYTIRLGLPLPAARYVVGRKLRKHVAYWSAEIRDTSTPGPENLKEIDQIRWVSLEEARNKLSRFADREQLEVVEHAWNNGTLRAWPFIIVRHGKAFPRSKWHETEQLRPLLGVGSRQAMALTGLLAAWAPSRLLSSPWKRCVATLKPYAASTGQKIKLRSEISEKAANANPKRTRALVRSLLEKGRSLAICTHRPVLPAFLDVLRDASPKALGDELPAHDPYMAPGEILVAYIRPGPVPRIVDVERHRPIDT